MSQFHNDASSNFYQHCEYNILVWISYVDQNLNVTFKHSMSMQTG